MSDGFDKPSNSEEEYFVRQEVERRKKWAAENTAKMAAEEKERLKQLHFMKCPSCGMDLQEIELRGIKVDQCPACGGIFLDKGEVDQLAKRDNLIGKAFSIFS